MLTRQGHLCCLCYWSAVRERAWASRAPCKSPCVVSPLCWVPLKVSTYLKGRRDLWQRCGFLITRETPRSLRSAIPSRPSPRGRPCRRLRWKVFTITVSNRSSFQTQATLREHLFLENTINIVITALLLWSLGWLEKNRKLICSFRVLEFQSSYLSNMFSISSLCCSFVCSYTVVSLSFFFFAPLPSSRWC